jgi:hypothetical protein
MFDHQLHGFGLLLQRRLGERRARHQFGRQLAQASVQTPLPVAAVALPEPGREPDKLSPKDQLDLRWKELETLQRDVTALITQARWWLTLWGLLLAFVMGDMGGARLTSFVQRLGQAHDTLTSDLATTSALIFLVSGALLLSAAWPQVVGRRAWEISPRWQLTNMGSRIAATYKEAIAQRGKIRWGLPLLFLAVVGGFLSEVRLEDVETGASGLWVYVIALITFGMCVAVLATDLPSGATRVLRYPLVSRKVRERLRRYRVHRKRTATDA